MAFMFNKATKFNSQICNWNLDGKVITEMFTGSLCSVASCITCRLYIYDMKDYNK